MVLIQGTEKQRLEAAQRLGVSLLRSADGDLVSKQALAVAIRNDPPERVREEILSLFWCMPDDGFDLYLERLASDPSESVRRTAIQLTNSMASGEYGTHLHLMSKMGLKYTREQMNELAEARRLQIIDKLAWLAASPDPVAAYAKKMLGALQRRN